MYLPICVCFNSAKKTGSTNRKSVNCKNTGTACSKSANCHICAKFTYLTNFLSPKIEGFAICGTFLRTAHLCTCYNYIGSFVDIDWQISRLFREIMSFYNL